MMLDTKISMKYPLADSVKRNSQGLLHFWRTAPGGALFCALTGFVRNDKIPPKGRGPGCGKKLQD